MREYEEGYPVDANDRYYQANYPDPDRRNSSNFGFANVKRNAAPGGNKAREDATDYLNERLKVMPYESTEVVFDQRVEFTEIEGKTQYTGKFPELPEVGKTYTVTYNGTVYNCAALGIDGMRFIGNAVVAGMDNTGEPFAIGVIKNGVEGDGVPDMFMFPLDGSTSATVKIEKSVIHTIDPKFCTAFRVNVWYNGSAYVADKTCAEIREAERKKYPIVGTYTNKAGKVYTMIGCDASSADLVRLAAFDVGSDDLVVYSIYIIEDGEVGVNVHSYAGINTDEV